MSASGEERCCTARVSYIRSNRSIPDRVGSLDAGAALASQGPSTGTTRSTSKPTKPPHRYARGMFELKITGGTIVDGTGRAGFVGDVAIDGGVIVAVGERVDGDAREVIDATGCIV